MSTEIKRASERAVPPDNMHQLVDHSKPNPEEKFKWKLSCILVTSHHNSASERYCFWVILEQCTKYWNKHEECSVAVADTQSSSDTPRNSVSVYETSSSKKRVEFWHFRFCFDILRYSGFDFDTLHNSSWHWHFVITHSVRDTLNEDVPGISVSVCVCNKQQQHSDTFHISVSVCATSSNNSNNNKAILFSFLTILTLHTTLVLTLPKNYCQVQMPTGMEVTHGLNEQQRQAQSRLQQ